MKVGSKIDYQINLDEVMGDSFIDSKMSKINDLFRAELMCKCAAVLHGQFMVTHAASLFAFTF